MWALLSFSHSIQSFHLLPLSPILTLNTSYTSGLQWVWFFTKSTFIFISRSLPWFTYLMGEWRGIVFSYRILLVNIIFFSLVDCCCFLVFVSVICDLIPMDSGNTSSTKKKLNHMTSLIQLWLTKPPLLPASALRLALWFRWLFSHLHSRLPSFRATQSDLPSGLQCWDMDSIGECTNFLSHGVLCVL